MSHVADVNDRYRQANAEAFLDVASPLSYVQRGTLVESALKHRLPGMFAYRQSQLVISRLPRPSISPFLRVCSPVLTIGG
jgi:hypothetical protein